MADLFEKLLAVGVASNAIDSHGVKRKLDEMEERHAKEKRQEKYDEEERNEEERGRASWERHQQEEREQQAEWDRNAQLTAEMGTRDLVDFTYKELWKHIQEVNNLTYEKLSKQLEEIKHDLDSNDIAMLKKIDAIRKESIDNAKILSEQINDILRSTKINIPKLMLEHFMVLFALAKKNGLFDKEYANKLPNLDKDYTTPTIKKLNKKNILECRSIKEQIKKREEKKEKRKKERSEKAKQKQIEKAGIEKIN